MFFKFLLKNGFQTAKEQFKQQLSRYCIRNSDRTTNHRYGLTAIFDRKLGIEIAWFEFPGEAWIACSKLITENKLIK